MDLATLYRYVPALESELRRSYARGRRSAPEAVRPYLDASLEFSLRGGKRFRAMLALAGYYLATGKSPRPVLPAAAALEHFQSWMLIHDDVIDHAEERRGGPSLHRAMARAHAREGLGARPRSTGSALPSRSGTSRNRSSSKGSSPSRPGRPHGRPPCPNSFG